MCGAVVANVVRSTPKRFGDRRVGRVGVTSCRPCLRPAADLSDWLHCKARGASTNSGGIDAKAGAGLVSNAVAAD
jgi:hypothetical protein